MRLLRNPELRGILVLALVILVIGAALAAVTGRLEMWFNIPWLSGPRLTDSIVFVSGPPDSGDLWVMGTDGSDRRRLTTGANVLGMPAISPAGNRIAFVGVDETQSQVLSTGAAGGEPSALTAGGVPKRKPGYSPDGRRLSYIAAGKVYVADLDGGSPSPVLPTREELHATVMSRSRIPTYTDYAWGPDSQSMAAVTRDAEGNDSLTYLADLRGEALALASAVHDAEGGGVVIILPEPDKQPVALMPLDPADRLRVYGLGWASEQPLLAAVLVAGENSVVLVFDAQQKQAKPVFAIQEQRLGALAVSPDGGQAVVCLASAEPTRPGGLLRLDLESGEAALIAQGVFDDPCYSPDGSEVLATVTKDGKRDVAAVDVSSGDVRRLTTDGRSSGAIWSPASGRQ